jgi:hypothetical protein
MIELYVVFAALQLADMWTTHTILSQGGRELNPVLAKLFNKFGHLPVLVVFKSAVLVLVYFYVLPYNVVMYLLISLYSVVVVHNYTQIKR